MVITNSHVRTMYYEGRGQATARSRSQTLVGERDSSLGTRLSLSADVTWLPERCCSTRPPFSSMAPWSCLESCPRRCGALAPPSPPSPPLSPPGTRLEGALQPHCTTFRGGPGDSDQARRLTGRPTRPTGRPTRSSQSDARGAGLPARLRAHSAKRTRQAATRSSSSARRA